MSNSVAFRIPRSIAERLEKKARELGISLEEYVVELILRDLDPPERVRDYMETSKDLLEQAREELKKSNVRQATKKSCGAAALAVKAYAELRESRRLTSHRELWEYKRKMEREFGDWVSDVWAHASVMHICFYETWCSGDDVEKAVKRIERLVYEVERGVSA